MEPVLILDDVFAELDETRRERLADLVADGEQVLITAAVAADVPARLAGRRFTVQAGDVTLAPSHVIPADAGIPATSVTTQEPEIPGQARDDGGVRDAAGLGEDRADGRDASAEAVDE